MMMSSENTNEVDYCAKILQYETFFYESLTRCPYGLQEEAIFKQASVNKIDPEIFDCFILAGYRRAGNLLYTTNCPGCTKCIPIRIRPYSLRLNRSQKRAKNKNSQLHVITGEPTFTREKLNLYTRFLQARYPTASNPAEKEYTGFFVNSCTRSFEICYYQKQRLVGVSTVDISQNIANAVYFFFDPMYQSNGLGIFNIIYLTEYCQKKKIEFLVTGYLIKELSSMNYKGAFYPHDLFVKNKWLTQEKKKYSE